MLSLKKIVFKKGRGLIEIKFLNLNTRIIKNVTIK